MIKPTLLVSLLVITVINSSALSETRQRGLQCVKDYYGLTERGSTNPDLVEVPGFAPDLGTQLLQDIVARADLQLSPIAIKCDGVANAFPFQPKVTDALPSSLSEKQFVIYNLVWIQQTLGKNRDRAVFVLGHEIGHISKKHLTSRSGITRLSMETEADYEGFCAVARLGGEWAVLEDLVLRLRGDYDGEYPSAAKSLAIGRNAFSECGGNQKPNSNSTKNEIVYFYKRADSGNVVAALSSLGVKFETRQSGVFKGIDYSDRLTDTVTCHKGVPIDFVRRVALALFDEGVKLKAINEPDEQNKHLKDRIIIEAAAKNRPILTRMAISELQECPSRFDPIYGKGR